MSKILDGIVKDIKSVPKKAKAKLKGGDTKKLILQNFPYLLFAYFFNKIAWLYRVSTKEAAFDKVLDIINSFDRAFSNPLPSFHLQDVLIGVAGGIVFKLIVYYKAKNAKKFRYGREYGSARWGNEKDIEPYVAPVFENNVILTETERLMMSGRPKESKYARNKNILVIGGSGFGKPRFFCKAQSYADAQLLYLTKRSLHISRYRKRFLLKQNRRKRL